MLFIFEPNYSVSSLNLNLQCISEMENPPSVSNRCVGNVVLLIRQMQWFFKKYVGKKPHTLHILSHLLQVALHWCHPLVVPLQMAHLNRSKHFFFNLGSLLDAEAGEVSIKWHARLSVRKPLRISEWWKQSTKPTAGSSKWSHGLWAHEAGAPLRACAWVHSQVNSMRNSSHKIPTDLQLVLFIMVPTRGFPLWRSSMSGFLNALEDRGALKGGSGCRPVLMVSDSDIGDGSDTKNRISCSPSCQIKCLPSVATDANQRFIPLSLWHMLPAPLKPAMWSLCTGPSGTVRCTDSRCPLGFQAAKKRTAARGRVWGKPLPRCASEPLLIPVGYETLLPKLSVCKSSCRRELWSPATADMLQLALFDATSPGCGILCIKVVLVLQKYCVKLIFSLRLLFLFSCHEFFFFFLSKKSGKKCNVFTRPCSPPPFSALRGNTQQNHAFFSSLVWPEGPRDSPGWGRKREQGRGWAGPWVSILIAGRSV